MPETALKGSIFSPFIMHRTLLATVFASLLATPLWAADPPAPKQAAKRAPVPAVPETPTAASDDLLPRSVFDVLLGEIALQRGQFDYALSAYVDLARRSQNPKALARAIEIAQHVRQNELALELSRVWTRAEPESFKAQQALTLSLLLLNRTEELADQIALMLERDKPKLAENLLYLNRMLARQTDRKAVNRIVEKVATPYKGIAEAHYAMALAALSAGDQERARAESAAAMELRPDWEAGMLMRTQVIAKESIAEAIESLEKFVPANPQAFDARLSLARLLLASKRYEEARRRFDEVLAAHPNAAEVLYPAAMLALQQNDHTGGRMFLERLLTTDFPDKSTVHYFLGQIDEDEKKLDDALAHYQKVVAGDQYLVARSRLAQITAQRSGVDAGLKLLRASGAKTTEEKTTITLAEAGLLRDAKRYREAFEVLESLLKTQPDNAELLYDSALLAERLGKFDILESRLKRVIELKPTHAHAFNALGYTLADRNIRLDEAATLIRKALALAPEDPFIMDSLGWVQFRQGKLGEALTTLQAAYKLRADPEIAAHLGEVLWTLDRRDEATKVWAEAAARNPDNDELTAVIRKFKP